MSEYLITFAYAERRPDSRIFDVALDLQRDFQHVALFVATISGDQLGRRGGRHPQEREKALWAAISGMARWIQAKAAAGTLDQLLDAERQVVVVPAEDVVMADDPAVVRGRFTDGTEISRFMAPYGRPAPTQRLEAQTVRLDIAAARVPQQRSQGWRRPSL